MDARYHSSFRGASSPLGEIGGGFAVRSSFLDFLYKYLRSLYQVFCIHNAFTSKYRIIFINPSTRLVNYPSTGLSEYTDKKTSAHQHRKAHLVE